MNQCDRIAAMEQAYDRAHAALDAFEAAQNDLHTLAAYMDGGLWLTDYEADEAGQLPATLRRGILSQDALYNLLCRWHSLCRSGVPAPREGEPS